MAVRGAVPLVILAAHVRASLPLKYGYNESKGKRLIGCSSPATSCEIYSSPLHPDRLWGPPSLLSNGYQGIFPGG
jgi:hypothetical protein